MDRRRAGRLRACAGGRIHAFRNESGEPATMLLHFAGAPREGYFERLPTMSGASQAAQARFFLEHDPF